MKGARALAAPLFAALFAITPARAAGPDETKAQAKSYFDAALQAYAAAQYIAAADAFLKAHELLPSHSLIFSAAQAYRRQFYIDQSPDHLRRALALYRDYLSNAEQGRRRQEASDALDELVGFEARLAAEPPRPQRERPTQILVTSRTPFAQTSIDGGPPRKVPLVARVSPGEHEVVVRAPGHFDDRSITIAVLRETIPVNVVLRPKAVELRVRGDEGARVFADGILLARLPLAAPLRITGGDHQVSVLLPGRVAYSTSLSAASGSRVDLDVALPRTPQRYAALTTLGLSGASILVAGALGGLAADAHGDAEAIDAKRSASELSGAERDAYNSALERRDSLGAAAASVGAAAAALGILGIGLYVFDTPDVAARVGEGADPGAPARSPSSSPDTELFVDARGISLRKRF